MNDNARGFCVSCGVSRNHGDTCDYCGRHYIDPIESFGKAKRLTALPSKYTITKANNGSVITWRWASKSGWVLILFAMIWIAITFPVAAEFLRDPLDTLFLPLIPLAAGVLLLCHAFMKLINKTSVYANRQSLYIKHHPIPWTGKVRFDTSNIEQVFVSRIQRSNKETSWHAPALQLATKDGHRHELLRGSAEVEFTDFESLRLIILKALDITPETVAGAYDSFS